MYKKLKKKLIIQKLIIQKYGTHKLFMHANCKLIYEFTFSPKIQKKQNDHKYFE
jgi:UDP-N-acetylglucosamine transferase subunit ALG13